MFSEDLHHMSLRKDFGVREMRIWIIVP